MVTGSLDDPNDPLNMALNAVQGIQRRQSQKSNFPAVNSALNTVQGIQQGQSAGQTLRNTQFARNAPVNTLDMNTIPVGGFGLGLGYQRPPLNVNSFLNPPQQPTMTGFRWNTGTGGLQGGNNDLLRQFYSNGTMQSFTGGVQNNQPLAPTQYTLPGVNADPRALSDPSVGALEGAQRSTNQYGQQVVNPVGGGQIISGKGPSYGSLQGSTPAADAYNRPGLNTPSGGQAFAGPSLRKPMQSTANGQVWRGGWLNGGIY